MTRSTTGKLADPQFRHDRALHASLSRTTSKAHLSKLIEKATEVDSVDQWAEQTAESLPPLTSTEAAAIGKLAAALDARREAGVPDEAA